ncbi:substrate-binding domain-containing protein [Blautia sp. An46]|uniref:substrate-binding domain-containing protein n=1 Tax=Blautia sp. An46 TaxID=1965636 RepID=UPI000B3A72E8|nr:substrate-binding domain-containing protein [Blautia sp. An46]OUN93707.1 phosphate ABC transporter substrate-binding protein [Blautia sp. An46]
MKKKVLAAVLMGAMVFSMAACGSNDSGSSSDSTTTEDNASSDSGSDASAPSGTISVLSREEGSGTRGAFVELFGVEEENADGEKVDNTTVDAQVTNSTAVMMTGVAQDPQAIGYISLGSLDDSVKALKVDGAEASAENVKNGTYKVSRPFNIVTGDGLSDVAQDFVDYILSSDGQAIVGEDYIPVDDAAEAYAGTSPEGSVVVAGSSSVSPVMEKLKEGYEAVNPNASIEIQTSDSTTGVESTISGICDIGMASRELKDTETSEGVTGTQIAIDGIAVIVNNENSMTDITSDQVKQIYTGEVTNWEDLQ